MVELLVIGGLAEFGSAIGTLICSGRNNQSSSQSTSNTNQNLAVNNTDTRMPLQSPSYHAITYDYNYPINFKNNYINSDSSYNTNYSSYGGNYGQSYYMYHQYNNPLNDNHYIQTSNRIKRIEINNNKNLPYGFNRSPTKNLNNINKSYGFDLRNFKKRDYLSPHKYIK